MATGIEDELEALSHLGGVASVSVGERWLCLLAYRAGIDPADAITQFIWQGLHALDQEIKVRCNGCHLSSRGVRLPAFKVQVINLESVCDQCTGSCERVVHICRQNNTMRCQCLA